MIVGQPEENTDIPNIVKDMCRAAGVILSRYRTGKLPKIIKTYHMFSCWEELVHLSSKLS